MSLQIAVRLPDGVVDRLDALVRGGVFETRADAVRAGIEHVIDAEERRRIGEQIIEGYRRIPQSRDDEAEIIAASIRSIEAEPW